MTQAERDRLVALKKAKRKLITQKQAAEELGITQRHVRRLVRELKRRGDKIVAHGLRGLPSNRKISADTEKEAVTILSRPVYRGFGPTLASEYLAKKHSIEVSRETVRQWMIEAKLWRARKQRVEKIHQWRPRRGRFGELVQWDTSDHDWLEGRGPVRYLVRLIDDATSWSWGRFVERDATPFNMAVLWEYLEKNGRMVDVYTDRHAMFAVPPRPGESQAERVTADRLTQIGRGLRELGIGWIAAYSPPAKGRVERSLGTDQDRLVKHLRLAKIATLEAANAFLETEYWPEWNVRFARPLQDFPNQHRPLTPYLDLAAILCHVEPRVIGNDYTFSFAGRRYQIARQDAQAGMRHQRLRVELRLNGELQARYQDRYVHLGECGAQEIAPQPAVRKPVRKDHNAGGKSSWMQGFFDRPSPPLWKLIGD